jgi:tape measure domain-containing protein
MANPATEFTIQAKVVGADQVEGLKSAVQSLRNRAIPAAEDINKLRDAAKSLGNAAEASTSDLRTSVTVLKSLKDQVALTSKEYRDLSNDLKTVENRFNAANTAAKQFSASAGPLSGGTAGAGIMGRPTEKLDPYMRLGFETNDPEYWRKRQETHPGGAAIFPQQLDYAATNKALSSMQSANDQMTAVANKGRQDRLLVQEKYNQLEIAQQDAAHKKQLLNQQRMDDIEGRFFEMRLNNAASIREKAEQRIARRRQRLVTAGRTAGAVAAAGIFGGPEGLVGAGIGAALGGEIGAFAGGAIGAQVGMLRQAIADTATYASEIAKLNIALRGITKTSEEYANAQRAISLISNTLNVPIKEATAGFTKLSASVIGAGGNVNDAQIVMLGFTQAIKATSGGAEEVSGAMTALTQIFSKGKVSAEEINQIAERLPGAFTAIAKAGNRTGPELQDALEKGEVGLNDLMKTAQYLTDQYGASASKMAASAEESGARMTVALDKLKLAIGETYQPIGSEFQESITNATNIAILAMESHKKNTEDLGKTISKTFGEETTKNIGDWFQRFNLSVAASVLGLQPLLNAINAINNYMGTQKTGQQKMIDAGSPNMYSDAQGNVYDAITGRLIMKPPTKFELPKAGGDDKAAKKEAKLKQQIELQRELNDIESQFNAYELPRLKGLQETQLQLAALAKDANVEAKKKLQLKANELEYELDALRISKQQKIELAKIKTIEDQRLQFVQNQGIIEKTQDELKKLNLTRDTKRKAIEQGVTLELKEREKVTAKQLTDSQRLFSVLEDQLAIARATTPEQKIRLESQARINELNLSAVELNKEQQDQAVKLQNAENLKSQILLEQINLKERLAALDPLQQFINQSTTQLENLKGVAVSVSQSIGEALGNSVSSGIQGLVEGTANAQQIFSDFLKSIGQILIQEGAKMIATYTAIAIAKSLAGLFGGGGANMGGKGYFNPSSGLGVAGPNFNLAKGGVFSSEGMQTFANGGAFSNSIVNSPTLFKFANGGTTRTGLMGEAGPEAIMPLKRGADGKLGVAADMTAAMARYQRQGSGSGAGGSGSDAMAAGEATPVLSMSFETTRFLGQDYVSTDQLQAAMMATEKRAAAAGAKAGAAQITSKLQQSPSYRRQVGLR